MSTVQNSLKRQRWRRVLICSSIIIVIQHCLPLGHAFFIGASVRCYHTTTDGSVYEHKSGIGWTIYERQHGAFSNSPGQIFRLDELTNQCGHRMDAIRLTASSGAITRQYIILGLPVRAVIVAERIGRSDRLWRLRVRPFGFIANVGVSFVLATSANVLFQRTMCIVRRRRKQCTACGYDLRYAVSDRCPECGSHRDLSPKD